jgi:hypothetical protein
MKAYLRYIYCKVKPRIQRELSHTIKSRCACVWMYCGYIWWLTYTNRNNFFPVGLNYSSQVACSVTGASTFPYGPSVPRRKATNTDTDASMLAKPEFGC